MLVDIAQKLETKKYHTWNYLNMTQQDIDDGKISLVNLFYQSDWRTAVYTYPLASYTQ